MSEAGVRAVHRGHCLCGDVRYEVKGALTPAVACHCTQCRRQTGHFLVSADVATADVTLTGSEHIRWYEASALARRGFCGRCGSFLFWMRPDSGRIAIALGGFETPTGTAIDRHIFVADKGDYYRIDDGAPQFAGSD